MYQPSCEGRLIELGLINPRGGSQPAPPRPTPVEHQQATSAPSESLLDQLLQEQESLKQQNRDHIEEIKRKENELESVRKEQETKITSMISKLQQVMNEKQVIMNSQQQLEADKHKLQQRLQQAASDIQRLQQENAILKQRPTQVQSQPHFQYSVPSGSTTDQNRREFWQISPEEISIHKDQIIGTGAWGYVTKGTYHGTNVAVKRIHREIIQQATLERVYREISTMAQLRHPNLVLFIAAVLSNPIGPVIVTELLELSLREAYQSNRVGANKRKIFRDLSSALVYLHCRREPIIHRDVSSANVLLSSQSKDSWLAKLSDFGSANLARHASTPGEGSIIYTAPEAYPQPPTSPTPRPQQTIKIDVYSFGILVCEVTTETFPNFENFSHIQTSVSSKWPRIESLISSCISHSPQDRPAMEAVLSHIQALDWEPSP